jgi:hypothetical protein
MSILRCKCCLRIYIMFKIHFLVFRSIFLSWFSSYLAAIAYSQLLK